MRFLFSSLQLILLILIAASPPLCGNIHDDSKQCPCKEWSQSMFWNSSQPKSRGIKQVCVQVNGYASTGHIERVRRLLLDLQHGELTRRSFYMNIEWLDDHWDVGSKSIRRHCDVILRVVDDVAINASAVTSMRWSQYLNCPGDCSPVPSVGVPVSVLITWIADDALQTNKADRPSHNLLVTCSLTLGMLSQAMRCPQFDSQSDASRRTIRLAFLLYSILWRRVVECGEQRRWDREVVAVGSDRDTCVVYERPLYRLVQRKVFALIIWIGNSESLDLLRRQALTLRRQSFDSYFGSTDEDFVAAWLATDETYPCREGSTACLHPEKYRGSLPKSNTNSMSVGWRCAQRRPLRSLSHSLLLFDPQVVLLLDDDTFLNYELFRKRHRLDVLGVMMQQTPVVFGEFVGTSQQLSKRGVMAGGSGYVMGREAVRRLRDKACVHYGTDYEDSVRSKQQILSLSISREVQELCASESSHCIAIPPTVLPSAVHPPYFAPISIRLIDLCTSLMAGEHMCIHSDHSMGRCLLYGAHAAPVGMACERKYVGPLDLVPLSSFPLNETSVLSSYRSPTGEKFSFVSLPILSDSMPEGIPGYVRYSGMCFRQRYCDLEESITCHRFQASLDTTSAGVSVERLYSGRSFKHKNNYGPASTCEIISNNALPRSCF